MKGKVYLIGAGPGDPGLLTIKGRRLLSRADVVVYDALVNPHLLDFAKPGASLFFVGKRGKGPAKDQREINELMRRQAERGRLVARLKGGDPFLFGRGGEEASYLHDHHVPFEIIPGVSSASGAAAYAGIPLTDRHLGSMVTMVTGHEGEGKHQATVEWSRISRQSTLVIFMGLDQIDVITERLLRLNWDEKLPAAVIQWGSTTEQKIIEGALGDIADKAMKADIGSPALIVIGRVVGLRKALRWFDTKPLFGKQILITRTAEQAPEFAQLLEDAGAHVVSFPVIQILPPASWEPVDRAIREAAQFDWILFTSANGVRAFFDRLQALGQDVRDLKGIRLGAIGPKTAACLAGYGLKVDVFPAEYRAEALADAVGQVRNCRVLLARAAEARDVLPKTLEARGAAVTVAPVYRTIKTRKIGREAKARLLDGKIDAVTFTSSSTVDGLMQHFDARERAKIFQHAKAAVIGPVTAGTLKTYGIRPAIRAPTYTTEALARAIVKFFAR